MTYHADFNEQDAIESATDDWIEDAEGRSVMDRLQFNNFLYNLCAIWCDGDIEDAETTRKRPHSPKLSKYAAAYCLFLNACFLACTRRGAVSMFEPVRLSDISLFPRVFFELLALRLPFADDDASIQDESEPMMTPMPLVNDLTDNSLLLLSLMISHDLGETLSDKRAVHLFEGSAFTTVQKGHHRAQRMFER